MQENNTPDATPAARFFSAGRFLDPTLWAIIAGNVFAMFLALTQNWSLVEILWVYWAQSVIIGVMAFMRMMKLKNFSTKGLKFNGRPVEETQSGAQKVAVFFALHYGLFHLVYYVFLFFMTLIEGTMGRKELLYIAIAILVFLASHVFSWRRNIGPDLQHPRPSLGRIMFMPYLRVVPMHITIILGFIFMHEGRADAALLLFMALKTVSDAITHMIEHYIMQRRNGSIPPEAVVG